MTIIHKSSGRLSGLGLEGLENGFEISRLGYKSERYWGTPPPVWICESCGHQHCIGSIEEMNFLKTESSPTPKELHRPYVDDVKLCCTAEGCKGEMVREPYVMDCWFDSGCASFAQWHYPFENKDKFENSFPVDYICEAVDQTRGWFYSLLAVSTTVLTVYHIVDVYH